MKYKITDEDGNLVFSDTGLITNVSGGVKIEKVTRKLIYDFSEEDNLRIWVCGHDCQIIVGHGCNISLSHTAQKNLLSVLYDCGVYNIVRSNGNTVTRRDTGEAAALSMTARSCISNGKGITGFVIVEESHIGAVNKPLFKKIKSGKK